MKAAAWRAVGEGSASCETCSAFWQIQGSIIGCRREKCYSACDAVWYYMGSCWHHRESLDKRCFSLCRGPVLETEGGYFVIHKSTTIGQELRQSLVLFSGSTTISCAVLGSSLTVQQIISAQKRVEWFLPTSRLGAKPSGVQEALQYFSDCCSIVLEHLNS